MVKYTHLVSSVNQRFRSGDVCVYQDVWRQAVWMAKPTRVIEDDGAVIVTHIIPGTWIKAQPPKPGLSVYGTEQDAGDRQRERIFAMLNEPASNLVDRQWSTNRRITIAEEGARHLISLFWRASDDLFLGWYVDFVESVRRTAIGIATMDLMLDIEIDPDLSAWSWKDDEHFEAALSSGLYSAELGRNIRAEAARVVERIESRSWPFNTSWPSWRPDPDEKPPMLPSGWSTVFA